MKKTNKKKHTHIKRHEHTPIYSYELRVTYTYRHTNKRMRIQNIEAAERVESFAGNVSICDNGVIGQRQWRPAYYIKYFVYY